MRKFIEVTLDGLEAAEKLSRGTHECPDGETKRTWSWNGTDITEIVAGWRENPPRTDTDILPSPESPGYDRARKARLHQHEISLQLEVEDIDGLMEFLTEGDSGE